MYGCPGLFSGNDRACVWMKVLDSLVKCILAGSTKSLCENKPVPTAAVSLIVALLNKAISDLRELPDAVDARQELTLLSSTLPVLVSSLSTWAASRPNVFSSLPGYALHYSPHKCMHAYIVP